MARHCWQLLSWELGEGGELSNSAQHNAAGRGGWWCADAHKIGGNAGVGAAVVIGWASPQVRSSVRDPKRDNNTGATVPLLLVTSPDKLSGLME